MNSKNRKASPSTPQVKLRSGQRQTTAWVKWAKQGSGSSGVADTKTAYYTAEGERKSRRARNHPEWADLPCQIEPGAQTGYQRITELPVLPCSRTTVGRGGNTDEKFGTGSGAVTRIKVRRTTRRPRADQRRDALTGDGHGAAEGHQRIQRETGALEKQSARSAENKDDKRASDNKPLGSSKNIPTRKATRRPYIYTTSKEQVEEVKRRPDVKKCGSRLATRQNGLSGKTVDSQRGRIHCDL